MPLNTEVDYNNVVIKGTVELGVKGERGLQGFKDSRGIKASKSRPQIMDGLQFLCFQKYADTTEKMRLYGLLT